jgi:alpha-galactosidase
MAARITIVGGGSTHWGPSLLVDFANNSALCDSEVVLMDLDEEALAAMTKAGAHIAESCGIPLSVRGTPDLDEALDGSQFVITAFSVGGFSSMRHDIEIPARYGVRQPVGDSVGPGGISRSLRSIPVLLGVAQAMEKYCPDALLINVTNPLTALCRAASKETSVRVVGLCNEVVGLKFSMSLLFDAPMQEVDPVIAGVNHLPVATKLRIGEEDGFAMLHAAIKGDLDLSAPIWLNPLPDQMHWRKRVSGGTWTKADVLENLKVKLELFERFGALAASSDTHVVEFLPGFVTDVSDFGRDWGVHHYGIHGHMADKARDNENLASLLSSETIPKWPSGELVAPVIEALVGGEQVALPVNLPNEGQVENLPKGAVVECIGLVDSNGVRPRDRAEVPSILGEYLRRVSVSQELTVEAALSGSRTKVLEAMLTDPFGGRLPYEHAVAMTDELIAATSAWLPQFG